MADADDMSVRFMCLKLSTRVYGDNLLPEDHVKTGQMFYQFIAGTNDNSPEADAADPEMVKLVDEHWQHSTGKGCLNPPPGTGPWHHISYKQSGKTSVWFYEDATGKWCYPSPHSLYKTFLPADLWEYVSPAEKN